MKSVTPPVNTDRRRGRWDGHREQRRAELTAAAIEAIRQHGPEVGMDAIAAHAGVSKPVLYRYFADKSELWLAVGQRAGALVLEAMIPAVESVREERAAIAAAIDVYLAHIEADLNLYRFVVHQPDIARRRDVVADVVDTVASGLARIFGDRLRARGLDSGAALPWAYGVVGYVQSVGDWWLRQQQPISREALGEYLTAFLWGGVAGISRAADTPGGLAAQAEGWSIP
ncbi:TetR/AcrR family transcriptional regulator [Actinoplanes teichomyceticus]|uniref:TetR family transcriptional regulator n=1 Tax=Actinoplanes teichomyceticus TaxID=1867 RepID=A0A561WLA7_ACTTI|nr:TetR family transcriptional regulator [Actinoplanes teichomyceticus]TWG24657.1 TetR family transcriptional regulator [Actinoplanes teichomyceticus]GIF14680.1 TetR family transcriptional regulator [Actinoplanes teichomyceticus]